MLARPDRASTRLQVADVFKTFGAQQALSGVNFSLAPSSIHALVGANGAGKSTLVKVISGYHHPDAGSIWLDGAPFKLRGPQMALSHGIVTIYQESNLCPDLSVAENVMLGQQASAGGFITPARQLQQVLELLARSRLSVAPTTLVSALSAGQRQLVEVARALARRASVLILDEPTAMLTHSESETLFEIVRELRDEGVAVIYVSHRMPEIFSLCDTVTVLRDGIDVLTSPIIETTQDELVRAMIGRLPEASKDATSVFEDGPSVLVLDTLSGPGFTEVSLGLRKGRILGMYGLVGSGRTEVAMAIAGATPSSGAMLLNGRPFHPTTPASAFAQGLALVPEDRKVNGLFLDMTLVHNVTLPHLRQGGLSRAGFVSERKTLDLTKSLIARLGVKTSGPEATARSLSGGNQQKVVFAKSVAMGCEVLIVDEPTQGVDVAGKEEIYRLLRELTSHGVAILMITSDLTELRRLSDRIVVMREGRKVGELEKEASEEAVMQLASGLGQRGRVR